MARRCGAKHIFQVKMHKTPHCGTDFAGSDVKKWHAAVARSTFATQNAQNTTRSDQFLKVRCPKIARPCRAKHICKPKCAKHHTLGPILQGQMSTVARSTFASQNAQKTSVRDRFWKFRCPKIARRCGAKHICKSKCTKHLRVAAF